jgi:DNA polymerase-2
MTDAFLLTRQWRDTRQGTVLDFWWATDNGPRWTRITGQEIVFFVPRQHSEKITRLLGNIDRGCWRLAEVPLKTFVNIPVSALYCQTQRRARDIQQLLQNAGIACWETDIRPAERFLMERFITAAARIELSSSLAEPFRVQLNPPLTPIDYRPRLRMVSLDIETSMDAKNLYSIAVYSDEVAMVFMVGEGESNEELQFFANAKLCLCAFYQWLEHYDPDVIIGWNVVQFDLWVLECISQHLGLSLALGRAQQPVHWRQEDNDGNRRFITVPGRQILDGIELLKAANYRFESFSLQNVSVELLDEGKLITGNDRGQEITTLFQQDKQALAAYNVQDCKLVWQIFDEKKLLHFAMERSQLTGLLLDRVGGSVAAFEYLYLPRLHRRGYVAPNYGELQSDVISPGGYVMNSHPGIYDNVLVLDFKSLYPSIMRTFLIDPCAFWLAQHNDLSENDLVQGFNDAFFARDGHILPGLITHFSEARELAKRHRNAPLSHAIKIIMNSFYGVLGSTGCRFFDPRISSSITLRGHEIIQQSRDWIEEQGYRVIYGDTDSLFVHVEWVNASHAPKTQEQCQAIGQRLARELNVWWANALKENFNIESFLEIQFETHYLKFLMPTMRGSDEGTKKRYAGVVNTQGSPELVFKGLENVRTDWTLLARDFQMALYARIFFEEDYEEFVREVTRKVLHGESDDALVYRKRLRRHLHEYQKNVPPHVQAARKLQQWTGELLRRGDWIEYVITVAGAEPLQARQNPLDYQHYVDKQLVPVADTILHFRQQSLQQLLDNQLPLFG